MSFYRIPQAPSAPTQHQGIHDEWRLGATCEDREAEHMAQRARVYSEPFWAGVVPGGAKDTEEIRMHLSFDQDMYNYADARAEGLRPYNTQATGLKRAQLEVKSHTKALKDAHKVGIEFGPDTKVAPGVDTDLVVH